MKRLLLIPLVLFVFSCEDEKEEDCAGVKGGTSVLDCKGVCGGVAQVDSCGLCTGGTTGLLPNYLKDCSGKCGGDAEIDNCELCTGGTTGAVACIQDCADVWGGTALEDSCGLCTGGTTGLQFNYYLGCDSLCTGTLDCSDYLPESATLSGTVTFIGDWPTEGTVYLSIQTAWPPTTAPYSAVTITAGDVTDGHYGYSFTDVAFNTYPAITVSWLDSNDSNPATNQHTIGAYGGTVQAAFIDAAAVTIDAENATITELDITADFSLL